MPSIKIITTLQLETVKRVIKAVLANVDGRPLRLEAPVYAELLGMSEKYTAIDCEESADMLVTTLLRVFDKKEKTWACIAFFKEVAYSNGIFVIQLSPYVLPYLPVLFDSEGLSGNHLVRAGQ